MCVCVCVMCVRMCVCVCLCETVYLFAHSLKQCEHSQQIIWGMAGALTDAGGALIEGCAVMGGDDGGSGQLWWSRGVCHHSLEFWNGTADALGVLLECRRM